MKVYILRGIPGSGKSRLANLWSGPCSVICSADNFMVDHLGNYEWDPARKDEVHGKCFDLFRMTCADPGDTDFLIVDNTNIRIMEAAPYYQIASQTYNLDVEVITVVCDPYIAFTRCIHGLPTKTIYRMHLMLQAETLNMPSWWKSSVFFQEMGAAL